MMYICDTLEKYFQPYVAAYEKAAYEKGFAEGQKQAAWRIARRMIDLGIADQEILEVVSVTAEELDELRNEKIEYEKNRKDR